METAPFAVCPEHGAELEAKARVERDRRVVRKLENSVRFVRGMGDSGRRVEIVERDCPTCNYDRAVRTTHVSPEEPETWAFDCLNPNCSGREGGRGL